MSIAHDFAHDRNRDIADFRKEGYDPKDHSTRRTINAQRLAVVSDVHSPHYDDEMAALLLEYIDRYQLTCVVWNGDFWDMHKQSRYMQTEHEITGEQEDARSVLLIRKVAERLKKHDGFQFFIKGNHDKRYLDKLGGHIGMKSLICSMGPEVASLYGEGLIDSTDYTAAMGVPDAAGNPTWMFVHPTAYSSLPLQIPNRIAQETGYRYHIATGHTHHLGKGYDYINEHHIVETGGLFNEREFEYVQDNYAGRRTMQSGFVILQGSHEPILVSRFNLRNIPEEL